MSSADGIAMDDQICAVKEWPTPQNILFDFNKMLFI